MYNIHRYVNIYMCHPIMQQQSSCEDSALVFTSVVMGHRPPPPGHGPGSDGDTNLSPDRWGWLKPAKGQL